MLYRGLAVLPLRWDGRCLGGVKISHFQQQNTRVLWILGDA